MKDKPPRTPKVSANGGQKIPPPVSPKPHRAKNGSAGKKSGSKVTQAVAQLEKKDNGKSKDSGKLEKRDSGVVTPPVGGKKKPSSASSTSSSGKRSGESVANVPGPGQPQAEDVATPSLCTSVVSSGDCVVDIPEQGNVPGTVLLPHGEHQDDETSLHDQDIQTDLQLLKRKLRNKSAPRGKAAGGNLAGSSVEEAAGQANDKDSVAIDIEGDEAVVATPVGGRPSQIESEKPDIASPRAPPTPPSAEPPSDVTDNATTQPNNDSPQSNPQNNESEADKGPLDIPAPANKGSDKASNPDHLINTSTPPEESAPKETKINHSPVVPSVEEDNDKVNQKHTDPMPDKTEELASAFKFQEISPTALAIDKTNDTSITTGNHVVLTRETSGTRPNGGSSTSVIIPETKSLAVASPAKGTTDIIEKDKDEKKEKRDNGGTATEKQQTTGSKVETKVGEHKKDEKGMKLNADKQGAAAKEETKASEKKDRKEEKETKVPDKTSAKEETKASEKKDRKEEKETKVPDKTSAKEETKASEKKDKKEEKETIVSDKPSTKEEAKQSDKKDKKEEKGKKAAKDDKPMKSKKFPKFPGKAKKAIPQTSVTEPAAVTTVAEQDVLTPLPSSSAKSRWKLLQARHHELLLAESPRANGVRRDLSRTESLTVPGQDGRESPGRRDSYSPNSMRRGSGRSIDSKLSSIDLSKIAASMNDGGEKEKEVRKKNELTASSDNYLKNAIPYLPVPVAILLLMLNMCIPGVGTMLSGVCVLCCGRPRVQTKDDHVMLTLCINLWVGLAQLFSVTFMLVGWVWSLAWGIYMVILSVEQRKDVKAHRQKELQAKALTALNSQIRPWTLRT